MFIHLHPPERWGESLKCITINDTKIVSMVPTVGIYEEHTVLVTAGASAAAMQFNESAMNRAQKRY
jgi:hypothetical protein